MESAIENEDLLHLEFRKSNDHNDACHSELVTIQQFHQAESNESINATNCHWNSDAQDSMIIITLYFANRKKIIQLFFIQCVNANWKVLFVWTVCLIITSINSLISICTVLLAFDVWLLTPTMDAHVQVTSIDTSNRSYRIP